MSEAPRGLPSAFAAREQIERSLRDLEKRRADGSIAQEQYETSMAEYQQRLETVEDEIGHIKNGLRKQMESIQRDIDECKRALGEMQARHEVGELPAGEYETSKRELEAELQELERDGQGLERLLHARSSADLGAATGKPAPASPEVQPSRGPDRTRRSEQSPQEVRGRQGEVPASERPKLSADTRTPAASTGEPDVELALALSERDEARRLLASVEHLEIGGSITEEHRGAARSDYEARLARAEESVRSARLGVSARSGEIAHELSELQKQESLLDVRHKVGEYDSGEYEGASATLSRQRVGLEEELSRLNGLMTAETGAAATAVLATKDRPAAKGARSKPAAVRQRPVAAAPSAADRDRSRGGGLARLSGGPKSNMIGLGAGVVLAVVMLVMFVQIGVGFFGGTGLPSPNLPFSGNGETATESGSAAPSDLDEQTSTSSGAGSAVPTINGTGVVPLTVLGASEVGSLHVELVYDAASLEVVGVQWGQLPTDALFEYSTQQGRVTLGIVAPSGLGANQSLAVVSFRAVQSSATGQSPLYVENMVAHHSSSLVEMPSSASGGSVDLATMTVAAPTMTVGG